MNFHKNVIAIGALMMSVGAAQGGAVLVLDGFDSDPNMDAGGAADISSIVFSNPFGQSSDFGLDTLLDTGSDIGSLVFNSGIGVEQGGVVSYNADGVGLSFDAGAAGVEGFEIDFAMVDQAFIASIVLTTYDAMGMAIGDAVWAVSVDAGVDVTAVWSISDFDASGAFDASDIDDVTINFNLEDEAVASLDFIATEFRAIVPSPGSAVLLGLGGLMITRRQRS